MGVDCTGEAVQEAFAFEYRPLDGTVSLGLDFLTMDMRKSAIAEAIGIKTDAELARYFGITRSAVTQWGGDQPIPEKRQLWLQVNRPEIVRQLKER